MTAAATAAARPDQATRRRRHTRPWFAGLDEWARHRLLHWLPDATPPSQGVHNATPIDRRSHSGSSAVSRVRPGVVPLRRPLRSRAKPSPTQTAAARAGPQRRSPVRPVRPRTNGRAPPPGETPEESVRPKYPAEQRRDLPRSSSRTTRTTGDSPSSVACRASDERRPSTSTSSSIGSATTGRSARLQSPRPPPATTRRFVELAPRRAG